jgi:hypothetical protein
MMFRILQPLLGISRRKKGVQICLRHAEYSAGLVASKSGSARAKRCHERGNAQGSNMERGSEGLNVSFHRFPFVGFWGPHARPPPRASERMRVTSSDGDTPFSAAKALSARRRSTGMDHSVGRFSVLLLACLVALVLFTTDTLPLCASRVNTPHTKGVLKCHKQKEIKNLLEHQ